MIGFRAYIPSHAMIPYRRIEDLQEDLWVVYQKGCLPTNAMHVHICRAGYLCSDGYKLASALICGYLLDERGLSAGNNYRLEECAGKRYWGSECVEHTASGRPTVSHGY